MLVILSLSLSLSLSLHLSIHICICISVCREREREREREGIKLQLMHLVNVTPLKHFYKDQHFTKSPIGLHVLPISHMSNSISIGCHLASDL